ncbi:carboxylesterase family protein [Hymenobacter sp. BT186]|uniref:Carboxylesterase family protein n=1 Tax=Hymenobacter telluris TaxID=2816474 RepID=A0A939J9G0_9BACT|nr:alpha/beta hydrolase fold domain-containing protein [Hymenobacter telluris]MBO0357026.1 carboxylesterase family protein [Hymenobacter telluris]MBW3373053.1 carboxylesterase family protein [Hymenobacter norwichensis]
MKKLFHLILATVMLLAAMPAALAQVDTTGGRYYRPVFPNVTISLNVAYGSAVTFSGTTQQLLMDIYQPTGDTVSRRPVIIFAHQGGFVSGSRTDAYMADVCRRFAQLGYVTASIEYRLGFNLTGLAQPRDTPEVARAAIRGMQDMRAAVRFFRRDAATTRQYKVNPRYIVVGGSSAGGFMALEVGYLDKASEVPAYVDITALGGIEGNSGNPGYSSAVLAVLNLSGATESATIIEPGNVPLCSVHGTADNVVPYLKGRVGSLLPPKYVVGSGLLNPRATAVGIRNELRTFRNAGHIPFEGANTNGQAYADTTFRTIRDFLRPSLGQPGTVLSATAAASRAAMLQAYPVPATTEIQLAAPTGTLFKQHTAELLDATGRIVRRFQWEQANQTLPRENLKAGLYFLRSPNQPPLRVVFE